MRNCSLEEVINNSPFVLRSLMGMHYGDGDKERLDRLAALAAAEPDVPHLRAELSGITDEGRLSLRLREMRRDLLVSLAARDATGRCGYPEVVKAMTEFAELAVQAALECQLRLMAARYGVPHSEEGVAQDLLVVGMGKLGGAELNVSSDIDLVFLYDSEGETRPTAEFPGRRTVSNAEFFARVARRVIPMLSDIQGCGFVFRVDTRLRPDGDSGPIVCSSGMLEEYLYSQGRDWERFAWLKGRIVSRPFFSDPASFDAQCRSIEELVRPFVFRKYVDFSAISALSSLHDMIRAEAERREALHRGQGVNVKLGRGGIREIEFIAQTFQIIRGGRDLQLRSRSTLKTLEYLSSRGVIPQQTSEKLKSGYVMLRNLEHAIQYVDDQQTQLWPSDPAQRQRVASLYGMPAEELDHELARVRAFVKETFDSVFHAQGEKARAGGGWPEGWETGAPGVEKALEAKIAELGYERPGDWAERIAQLMRSKTLGRSNGALVRMAGVLTTVFEHCAEWAKFETSVVGKEEELDRCLNLLEVTAGRPTYVALLYQYPDTLRRVGRVLASSRWAADFLIEHPIILDELMDHRASELTEESPVDWSPWRRALEKDLETFSDDQERQLNLLRDAHHGAVFRLLMADLDHRLSIERLADHLSALADTVIDVVLNLAWDSLRRKFDGPPKFAVVAYGKLGGKELGYASDLDLIYLYDDDRPDAYAVYSRLVRRMMNWLTMQTSSGRLFDIDLRLRPNGSDGLIVSSFDSWRDYERNQDGKGAWTWEQQALTRARFCAGDTVIGQKFEAERKVILQQERPEQQLKTEIIGMRAKILEGHRNPTGLFDIKHDRGGMVDIEFVVQYLVLRHSCRHPQMLGNLGNINLLRMAEKAGLLPEGVGSSCAAIYRKYRAIQREMRLAIGDGPVRVAPEQVGQECRSVKDLWRLIFGTDDPIPASRGASAS